MKTGLKKRLLVGIKKTKKNVEKLYEAVEEEEERLQSKMDITVQCTEFCEVRQKVRAVLQRAPSDLRGGTFLQHPRCLVTTLCFQENPHCCLQILHAAMFQVVRGAHMLPRVLSTTENQEAQELLDEIQQQPGVFVLSCPAVAITNVVTASEFLADGWSTESVSRVVRAARAKQENNGQERAEHANHSYIQDEMKTFDTFPATVQGFDEGENPQKSWTQKLIMTMKPKSHYRTHCKFEDKLMESMRKWSIHQTAHWYAYCALVEPKIRSGSRQTQLWCVLSTETPSGSNREPFTPILSCSKMLSDSTCFS